MNDIQSNKNCLAEIEAIYKIVLRNIQPDNYVKLFPEDRPIIIQEVKNLLLCLKLSHHQKQLLLKAIELLKSENHKIPIEINHQSSNNPNTPKFELD